MNCQDMLLLLNDTDTERLATAQQAEVAGHLASCSACAEDWAAHEWLRNRSVAPMAEGLKQRLWHRLDASVERQRAGRGLSRTIMFGGLIATAAAAMLIATLSEPPDADGTSMLQPVTSPVDVAPPNGGAVQAAPDTPPATDNVAENPGASPTEAPRARVVVLPIRHENRSGTAIALSEAYYTAIIDALRSAPELELVMLSEGDVAAVDLTTATASRSTYAEIKAIAEHYGADGAITATNEAGMLFRLLGLPDPFGFRLRVQGTTTRGSVYVQGLRRPADISVPFEQVVQDVARRFRYRFARPEARELLLADMQKEFLDTSRSDDDRLTTLVEYRSRRIAGRPMEPLPETMVSAMIELGSTSTSPLVRSQVWRLVQGWPQPDFRDALLQALLYDPSEAVRREAANALAKLPDAAEATREIMALESNDELRAEQAIRDEWQALDADAQHAYVVAAVLDTDRTAGERVSAFDQGWRLAASPGLVERLRNDEQVLAALGDIGVSADDTRVRVIALRELAKAGHPDFVSLFVDQLGDDQPLEVRLTAANALFEHYADDAEAREALLRVREE